MQRNDVNKKIKEKNISSSSYMRFIELLSFFSITVDDIFEEMARNDKDVKNDVKNDFRYKLREHEKNFNGIKKYYDVLVDIFKKNNFSYDEKISKHMKKAEQKIIDDTNNSYKILMQYDEFKKFFKEILDDIEYDLKIWADYDSPFSSYFPTAIALHNYGICFNDYQVFTDMDFEENDNLDTKKMQERICNFIDEKIEQDKSYIDIFASFRKNWEILCNLFKDYNCISYLGSLCYYSDELLAKLYPNSDEKILDGRRVLDNAKKYYYFLGYKYDENSRVSVDTLKNFFKTQAEENPNYVHLCMIFFKSLTIATENTEYFKKLFDYVCTL